MHAARMLLILLPNVLYVLYPLHQTMKTSNKHIHMLFTFYTMAFFLLQLFKIKYPFILLSHGFECGTCCGDTKRWNTSMTFYQWKEIILHTYLYLIDKSKSQSEDWHIFKVLECRYKNKQNTTNFIKNCLSK